MPTITLCGMPLDLPDAAAAVAQRWMIPLENAATILLDSAPNFDPRIQPALTAQQLAPLFRGLVHLLTDVTPPLSTAGNAPQDSSPPLQSAVQDLVARYLEGFLEALNRLLRDWDQLGPIFFTHDTVDSSINYRLVDLRAVEPQPGALAQGAVPDLLLRLTIGTSDTPTAGQVGAALVYLPRDLACDCALIGNTARLCSHGPAFVHRTEPCRHPWCRSVAERINAQLATPGAIPTCTIWPAVTASDDSVSPGTAYGYRESLSDDQPEDTHVTSAQAPEVGGFHRTLGRELALAYAAGLNRLAAGDFLVHRRRPYLIGLACAFAMPNRDLASTGMFDPPDGPLAPPPRAPAARSTGAPRSFGLVVVTPGGRTPQAAVNAFASVPEIRRGCAETLEALAALAPELGDRFQNGRNLLSWFRPRDSAQTRERQLRWLELLSATSSWSDRRDLSRETARWRSDDDTAWTRHWFGGLLAQLQASAPAWAQLPPETADAFNPLRDQVTGHLGVRTLQEVRLDGILALMPNERTSIWSALVGLANLLSGYFRHAPWQLWLESSWTPLPVSALVELEMADHARARHPGFFRHLQQASLWSAVNDQEVNPRGLTDAPPPPLARPTFFPEPMSVATARQLQFLSNPGIRVWLAGSIPGLMEAPPPPSSNPRPVGSPLTDPPH